ncbi:ABC transporter ATP-binding protein [Phycicoccus sp.]|uniref:ABC transporter ATP-binding protein n=1 Tax=Phycicoccus sp. TaxID=1902410 RepID=UPI002BDBC5A2|nr:ABC transporter ATP-binding protein [Phycicoccus sp.]HMM97238.1 ABC transporter ATP-binding protein [Phycicoccus sp.]
MSTDDVIRIEGLVKEFGGFRALDGLDLAVRPGEVHGFLGPNGAGKSTTIRVLLGLVRADAGRIRLLDGDPWRDAPRLHARVAYLPGDVSLWPGLTGGQCLDVLGAIRGGLDDRRRDTLVERFDLDPTKRARDYSKGNRQKVALVAALAADADLLVLDEPTSGLDPLMEQVFQDVVRERRAQGATVLLSSHVLGEVEALADRVSIVRRGRTVTTGTLADLRRHTRTVVHAVVDGGADGLAGAPGVEGAETEPTGEGRTDVRLTVDAAHLDGVVGRLHAAGIHTLTVHPPSLDTLFLRTYEDDPAEEPTVATGARR